MKDLVELIGKCGNPVVRNALLAALARRGGMELVNRIASREMRTAKRDGIAAREAHRRIFNAADSAGALRKSNPKYLDPAIAEFSVMVDADCRGTYTRLARNAVRDAVGETTE